ncbi:class I SAM-dependent DNA methyltransferase [Lactobacillus terrae]|uniref:class I SAM-dependent DNA methyltransferase n=1 Tax=Lactobacillus terrae TaxID=2269374 RepID=UPI000C1B7A30|nr:class I SAM-dependent methyltransferase [Lactobacillus terrae]
MIYDSFASVYSELMDDSLYERWAEFVSSNTSPEQKTLLDVACGTGDLSIILDNEFDVEGTDLSTSMLEIAEDKAKKANKNIKFEQGNMLDLYNFGKYDIITCFDDSICYLKDEDQLYMAFKQSFEHLNENGVYMFDAHSLYQMDEVFPDYMFNHKTEDSAFMWSSFEGDFEHSIEHELTFFNWNEEISGYSVNTEVHKERTYPYEVFLQILKDVGFKDISISSDFGKSNDLESSTRWFFVAHK